MYGQDVVSRWSVFPSGRAIDSVKRHEFAAWAYIRAFGSNGQEEVYEVLQGTRHGTKDSEAQAVRMEQERKAERGYPRCSRCVSRR